MCESRPKTAKAALVVMVDRRFIVVSIACFSAFLDPVIGGSLATSSADNFEYQCSTGDVPFTSEESVKLHVQKRQFKPEDRSTPWVSVNGGTSRIIEPFPRHRMKTVVTCDVRSSPGRATCRATFTIDDAQPVDAGSYRCEIVSDSGSRITHPTDYWLPYVKGTPEHVDLKLVNENGVAFGFSLYEKIKIYEIASAKMVEGASLQCKANGTFESPKTLVMDSEGQHLSVNNRTDVYYTGVTGNEIKTNRVTANSTGDAAIESLIGRHITCTAESHSWSRDDIQDQIMIVIRQWSRPPEIQCDTYEKNADDSNVRMKCVVKGLIVGDEVWWEIFNERGRVDRSLKHIIGLNKEIVGTSIWKLPEETTTYVSWLNVSSAEDMAYKISSKSKYGTTKKLVYGTIADTTGPTTGGNYVGVHWLCVLLMVVLSMTL